MRFAQAGEEGAVLIQRSPEPREGGEGEDRDNRHDRPYVAANFRKACAFQHYLADNAQEMRDRERLADRLRPDWHRGEREHEA